MSPLQTILAHLPEFREVINGRGPKSAHALLQAQGHCLEAMPFNASGTYAPEAVEIADALEAKHRQVVETLQAELTRSRAQCEAIVDQWLAAEVDAIADQRLAAMQCTDPAAYVAPRKFNGWNVVHTKEGFYKAFKRINGAMVGIHVGRHWSDQVARAKIAAKLLSRNTSIGNGHA